MQLLVRQLQRVIALLLLLVIMLLLPSMFALRDVSSRNNNNAIPINSWYSFNLGKDYVISQTSYSKTQDNRFNFDDDGASLSVKNSTSFLYSELLGQYRLKSLMDTDAITKTIASNQLPFQVDFTVYNQRLTHSFATSNLMNTDTTTVPSYIMNITSHRYKRNDQNICYKFEEGDPIKKEFYSPDYPETYPKNISCFKVLEADPGMVLKVEFRDNFELEDQEKCTYDFLEVRDGKYGYSRLIGRFCRAFPFPEITSSSRYLWFYFHSDNSIQGTGFRAIWSMIPRPPVKTPESEECVLNVTNFLEYEIKTSEIAAQKKTAVELGTELDCIWNITVQEGWKIQMTFPQFHLDKPNECDINYVQVYDKEPSMTNNPSLINNFCGSIADLVTSKGSEAYLRFFVTKTAMNSSFEAIMTAVREKESKDKGCNDDEFDCQDACISDQLRCNNRPNCRYRFDEDADVCNTKSTGLNVNSEHVIIILIVFTLLMSGLCFTFIFNCMKKLIRDHRIIKEHIRQSRENRLDELGHKATPCPMAEACTEIGIHDKHHSVDSPSLKILTNLKELVPPVTMMGRDYKKESNVRLSIDLNDIHQSNNVRNATQERLQESSEEREMHDMESQTRESLFDSGFILKPTTHPVFTTFGVQTPSCSRKSSFDCHSTYQCYHYAQPHEHSQPFTYYQHVDHQITKNNISTSSDKVQQSLINSRCSVCHPSNDELLSTLCLRHSTSIVPAPPGWSTHESIYNSDNLVSFQKLRVTDSTRVFEEELKDSLDSINNKLSSKFSVHQKTANSGENYGFIYGTKEKDFSEYTASSGTSLQTFDIAKPVKCPQLLDSRFKTEAIIEVDQKRPFSIESSKSAPDVIATH